MSAELTLHARALQKIKDPEKRWRRFRQIARELSRLRRDDHRFDRNQLRREQWESTHSSQEPGEPGVPASQDEEFDEREIEQQEIAEQEIEEQKIEEQEIAEGGAGASRPGSAGLPVVALAKSGVPPANCKTQNSKSETEGAQWGETPSPPEIAEPETQNQNQKLETPPAGGASVPASQPETANEPSNTAQTSDSHLQVQLETTGGASVPASQPETPPQPFRKKLFSDPSYRSLRHAHRYDQLSW
jgi:hypothetical protein